MNTQTLSKQDWLDHGMTRLSDAGADAIKADLLAKSLGVSRGSFYWHFKNIADYRQALLDHWRTITTSTIIAALDERVTKPHRFATLLQRALRDNNQTERAIRAWALRDKMVASVVVQVDAERICYLARTLVDSNIADHTAGVRAKLSYWAYLGRLMLLDPDHQEISEPDAAELATLISLDLSERMNAP